MEDCLRCATDLDCGLCADLISKQGRRQASSALMRSQGSNSSMRVMRCLRSQGAPSLNCNSVLRRLPKPILNLLQARLVKRQGMARALAHMERSSSSQLLPSKGSLPSTNWQNTQPRLQMSTLLEYLAPRMSSGARYCRLATCLVISQTEPRSLTNPKSIILARPFFVIRFQGLMSRCENPWRCRQATASSSSRITRRRSTPSRLACLSLTKSSSFSSINQSTRHSLPSGSLDTPSIVIMLGWLHFFKYSASLQKRFTIVPLAESLSSNTFITLKAYGPLRTPRQVRIVPLKTVPQEPSPIGSSSSIILRIFNGSRPRYNKSLFMSIYDEVQIEDMDFFPESGLFYYPCPCGDRFVVGLPELQAGGDIARCPSCSLMIRVVMDPTALAEYADLRAKFLAAQ